MRRYQLSCLVLSLAAFTLSSAASPFLSPPPGDPPIGSATWTITSPVDGQHIATTDTIAAKGDATEKNHNFKVEVSTASGTLASDKGFSTNVTPSKWEANPALAPPSGGWPANIPMTVTIYRLEPSDQSWDQQDDVTRIYAQAP